MKPPTSVFALGRMRHLDLLALWHECNPTADRHAALKMARLSKDCLAALIAPARKPRT